MVPRWWRWPLVSALAVLLAYLIACIAFAAAEPKVVFSDVPAQPFARSLPAAFLWGTATSAHQVEGGNSWSDWALFELEPGRIKGGAKSGVAADHWNRDPHLYWPYQKRAAGG